MSMEIVFILEPDTGRITVETSNAAAVVVSEIKRDLGQGITLNCARPQLADKSDTRDLLRKNSAANDLAAESGKIYLFRLYHCSTVDGPGRRSVVQFAGCSIRCAGCYVPETHERANGKPTSIKEIVAEIDKRSGEHDGVTILGGEPFDQIDGLKKLVIKLKEKNYHLTIYTGYKLEDLLNRKSVAVERVLANTDLLIDGAFKREFTKSAGEYRGSSNQRLIFQPLSGV